ncbi:hypothetical protein IT571_06140 [Candidatus Sumerlaeota bacterium]|nr:hypothetical protein [Candidatus Sumerlaeota bacterium]
MSDSGTNNPGNFYSISPGDGFDGDNRNAWMKALEELSATPSPVAANNAASERERKLAEKKKQEAEKLCDEAREKVMNAITSLQDFTKAHPYLIAPNVFRMWEENLREIIVMMDRERTRSKVEQLPAQ